MRLTSSAASAAGPDAAQAKRIGEEFVATQQTDHRERHDATDFELRTQDKLQPVDQSEAVKDDAI